MKLPLDRAWIEGHLPHQGRMSLLDEIVALDETSVRAIARGHRKSDHPLRVGNELPAVCGIELGAQAAAAHGAACAGALSAMLIATIRACILVDVMSALLFSEIDLLTGRSKPEAGKRHALGKSAIE